jgi:hypothetical protein
MPPYDTLPPIYSHYETFRRVAPLINAATDNLKKGSYLNCILHLERALETENPSNRFGLEVIEELVEQAVDRWIDAGGIQVSLEYLASAYHQEERLELSRQALDDYFKGNPIEEETLTDRRSFVLIYNYQLSKNRRPELALSALKRHYGCSSEGSSGNGSFECRTLQYLESNLPTEETPLLDRILQHTQ